MRKIIAAIGGILVLGGVLAYLMMHREPAPATSTTLQNAPYSQESMDAHIRQRAEQIFRTRSLEAQLAVFDQILAAHPNDPIALQRAAELRKQIEELKTP